MVYKISPKEIFQAHSLIMHLGTDTALGKMYEGVETSWNEDKKEVRMRTEGAQLKVKDLKRYHIDYANEDRKNRLFEKLHKILEEH